MEIKRGAICIDDHDQLFIVTVDSPKPITWGNEVASEVWAGTLLVNGKTTLCANPRIMAESFKDHVAELAAAFGIESAKIEVAALRAEVIELRGRVL